VPCVAERIGLSRPATGFRSARGRGPCWHRVAGFAPSRRSERAPKRQRRRRGCAVPRGKGIRQGGDVRPLGAGHSLRRDTALAVVRVLETARSSRRRSADRSSFVDQRGRPADQHRSMASGAWLLLGFTMPAALSHTTCSRRPRPRRRWIFKSLPERCFPPSTRIVDTPAVALYLSIPPSARAIGMKQARPTISPPVARKTRLLQEGGDGPRYTVNNSTQNLLMTPRGA